jgi:hypothetical protein
MYFEIISPPASNFLNQHRPDVANSSAMFRSTKQGADDSAESQVRDNTFHENPFLNVSQHLVRLSDMGEARACDAIRYFKYEILQCRPH